jgi:TRAP-type C4-dicarboxylate transport system permease small subunit
MPMAQLILTWLRRIEVVVCVIAFSSAALALIADVLARELLGNGIFGAQRFAVWATAIAGLVGFALVTSEVGHLRPHFADKWLPRALDPYMDRVGDAVSALICIGLGVYAVDFVQNSFRLGERGMAIPIKVWPIQLILPWMFFSSAIRHLIFMAVPQLRPAPKDETH